MLIDIPELITSASTEALLGYRAAAFVEMQGILQTRPDDPEFDTLMVMVVMIDEVLESRGESIEKPTNPDGDGVKE